MKNNIWDVCTLRFNNNEILNVIVLQYDINELVLKVECDVGIYMLKCDPLYFSFSYVSVVRDREVTTKEGIINHEWAIGKIFILRESSKIQDLVKTSCGTLKENELVHYVICVEDGDVDVICHVSNKIEVIEG